MFENIKSVSTVIKKNLLQLDSQPIGKAALTVVVLLDLFIIVSIFDGLSEHTRQLTSPNEYISPICREVVISQAWNEENRIQRTANLVTRYQERPLSNVRAPIQHPICENLSDHVDEVKNDANLQDRLKTLTVLTDEGNQINAHLDKVRGAYETTLLETIAEVESGGGDSIKRAVTELSSRLDVKVLEKQNLIAELESDEKLTRLRSTLETASMSQREELAEEYRELTFWYPAKKLGMEILFLLPLILAFYVWNSFSTKYSRPFQMLVSSHLLVVVFIPVVIKVSELIYDIIPHKFLAGLIEFLESLGLVAIWHYVLMSLGILLALFLVYVFQKRLFSREKEIARRITRNLCQECGSRLGVDSNACTLCGFQQFHKCEHCSELTFVHGPYCRACGCAPSAST
ncbi:MAG: zinc ribbon domain-containing protein [Gammaproteobacteria bacterium]|nr:zinc ribbon domain-containing protein [Gammaproteobacteria bacterium]